MRYVITYDHHEFVPLTLTREWRSHTLGPSIDHHGFKITADNLKLNRFVRNVKLIEVK